MRALAAIPCPVRVISFLAIILLLVGCQDAQPEVPKPPNGPLPWPASLGGSQCTPAAGQPQFLAPSYLPPGFVKSHEEAKTDCAGVAVELNLSYQVDRYNPETGYFSIMQRMSPGGGVPAVFQSDTTVDVGGKQGYRAMNYAGNKHSITWSTGEIIVSITGTYVTFEEVLRIAESMQ